MPEINPKFAFEKHSLPLDDRTMFCPLSAAKNRWESVRINPILGGVQFDLLYELIDGRYVQLSYENCFESEYRAPDTGEVRRIWCGARVSVGAIVRACEAERFVREVNGTPSEELAAAAAEEQRAWDAAFRKRMAEKKKKKKAKPLDHWRDRFVIGECALCAAHDAVVGSILRETYIRCVEMVQVLREFRNSQLEPQYPFWLESLRSTLFGEFRVEPENWWGADDIVPPARVSLLELPWPNSLKVARSTIKGLRHAIELPCYCLVAWIRVSDPSDWRAEVPADADYAAAYSSLLATLPQLEKLVGQLGATLRREALLGRSPQDSDNDDELPPRVERALNSYTLAEQQLIAHGAQKVTDDAAYAWLREFGPDEYELPDSDTWKRYLREGRERRGEQKNAPRAGRTGRSIIANHDR